MNTSQQKSFIAAAECLNFTMAAEKLYISQPVLSRNIAALEAELGVLLFVRSSNTVRLTPGGEIMYQWMKEHQFSLSDAVMQAKQANQEPQGELRIGFVNTEVVQERESNAILAFKKRYPEVKLTISRHIARELTEKLMDRSIDIAAMIDTELSRDVRFASVETARINSCVAVSCAHPLAELGPISLRAFSNETFISVDPQQAPTMSKLVTQVCGAAGFVPRIREVGSTDEQLAMVEAQRGVALVAENHISATSPLVRLISIKEEFPLRFVCLWDKLNENPSIEHYLELMD